MSPEHSGLIAVVTVGGARGVGTLHLRGVGTLCLMPSLERVYVAEPIPQMRHSPPCFLPHLLLRSPHFLPHFLPHSATRLDPSALTRAD